MAKAATVEETELEAVAHVPIVKNTFIEVANRSDISTRRGSVPAALRLSRLDNPVLVRSNSEASTTASDTAKSLPESLEIPTSCHGQKTTSHASLVKCRSVISANPPFLVSTDVPTLRSWKPCYKSKLDKVIKRVVKMLVDHEFIAHVDASDNVPDWVIRLQCVNLVEQLAENVMSFAKQTLLESASECKCIYLMGYCTPKPFVSIPNGFEVTLGAMENANRACWHIFKKGFCRHDINCSKQHPVHTALVRVLIEPAPLRRPMGFAVDFKLMLVGLVSIVKSALEQSPCIENVRTWEDDVSKCWMIELASVSGNHDAILDLARREFFKVINVSEAVHIIEHAGRSIVHKTNGFVILLGESESHRLEHASCMVPINVVAVPA